MSLSETSKGAIRGRLKVVENELEVAKSRKERLKSELAEADKEVERWLIEYQYLKVDLGE